MGPRQSLHKCSDALIRLIYATVLEGEENDSFQLNLSKLWDLEDFCFLLELEQKLTFIFQVKLWTNKDPEALHYFIFFTPVAERVDRASTVIPNFLQETANAELKDFSAAIYLIASKTETRNKVIPLGGTTH